MTQEQLRKIDALIAEKVMGEPFRPFASILTSYPSKSVPETPFYSTDISAAWEVVEKIKPHWGVNVATWEAGYTTILFANENSAAKITKAESAPLAICLAALKSVGVDVSEIKS